jgi:hypothetical protein
MNLAHDEQFIVGMGYSDGYFGERTRPLLWSHWDLDEKSSYLKARYYGGYVAHRRSIRRLVGSQQRLVAVSIRALFGGFGIRKTFVPVRSPTGR